jgi:hypothetical protein
VIDRAKYLERQRRYNHSAKGRARWRAYNERHPQVSIFGERIRVPDSGFVGYAIQLREERYEQERAAYREWRDNVLEPELRRLFGARP